MKGVDYAYETGVKLIIVLDCGIKAVEEIAYAKEKGSLLMGTQDMDVEYINVVEE